MFHYYSKKNDNPVRVVITGEHKDGILKLAAARCSKKDQFIKKKGRTISENRLKGGKLYASHFLAECPGTKFLEIASKTAEEIIAHGFNKPQEKPKTFIAKAKGVLSKIMRGVK